MNNDKKLKKLLYSDKDHSITIDEVLSQAAEVDPSSVHVWYSLGVVYKLQDNLEESELKIQKALELDPKNVLAKAELARLFTFKGDFQEAEKTLLEILDSSIQTRIDRIDLSISTKRSILTSMQKKIVLEYAIDNYLSWANKDFEEKRFNDWDFHIQKAIEFLNIAVALKPTDKKFNELQAKISLNYGLRLYQRDRKEEGKKYLLNLIETAKMGNDLSSSDQKRIAVACYYLAIYEMKKTSPNLDAVDSYVAQGLSCASNTKIQGPLQELARKVMDEKNRLIGRVISFNSKKKYGLIQCNEITYIFFPSCLTWFCEDLQSLIDCEVSFIPVPDPIQKRPNRMRATQIYFVKYG
ncbi:MAG: tetratricopeptide repeat protein [Candidatus Hermodarchaeota archaeon]